MRIRPGDGAAPPYSDINPPPLPPMTSPSIPAKPVDCYCGDRIIAAALAGAQAIHLPWLPRRTLTSACACEEVYLFFLGIKLAAAIDAMGSTPRR